MMAISDLPSFQKADVADKLSNEEEVPLRQSDHQTMVDHGLTIIWFWV